MVLTLGPLRAKRSTDEQHEQSLQYLKSQVFAEEEQRQIQQTILVALEQAGHIKLARDSDGYLTNGFVITGEIRAQLGDLSCAILGTSAAPPVTKENDGN
jgi:hypothetical protein